MKTKNEVLSVGNITDEEMVDKDLLFEILKKAYKESLPPEDKLQFFDIKVRYSDCGDTVACAESGKQFTFNRGWYYILSKMTYILKE